jgi:hypothetical protein
MIWTAENKTEAGYKGDASKKGNRKKTAKES